MNRRVIAATELVLIFPAALFLTAVVARYLEPLQFAQEIVTWYSVRQWTLWVLLIGLPLGALMTGCVVLLGDTDGGGGEGQIAKAFGAIRTQPAMQIIAGATLVAGVILVVVVLHMMAN